MSGILGQDRWRCGLLFAMCCVGLWVVLAYSRSESSPDAPQIGDADEQGGTAQEAGTTAEEEPPGAATATHDREPAATAIAESAPAPRQPSVDAGPANATEMSLPQSCASSFRVLRNMLAEDGRRLPEDLRMPHDHWQRLDQMMRSWLEQQAAVEREMALIVSQVFDEKQRRGEVEYYPNPRGISDPKERRAANKLLRAAARPTQPRQIVCTGGAANRSQIIRVNVTDHQRLHALSEQRLQELRVFLDRLSIAMFPFRIQQG